MAVLVSPFVSAGRLAAGAAGGGEKLSKLVIRPEKKKPQEDASRRHKSEQIKAVKKTKRDSRK